jgi:RNA polymerase sigma factor (sigma-70 family)
LTIESILNHPDYDRLVNWAIFSFMGRHKLNGSHYDWDDLRQIIALKICESYREPDHGHLKITTIVIKNAFWILGRTIFRKEVRTLNCRKLDIQIDEQSYGRIDQNDLVEELLDSISERKREFVRLYYLEGLSLSEIGLRVGTSAESVRRNINRAIAHLSRSSE